MATAKKKPTAAQIAARKLFAERARAGTLGKKPAKKTAVRKKNPIRNLRKAPKKQGFGSSFRYFVELQMDDGSWHKIAGFDSPTDAKQYARAYHNLHPSRTIRVYEV